ncbi:alpha/beta fold hydrolase [uncultured Enterovirga sp.]|uniref:alpha/beta fold hydrolase n=1 Tax=uncultured Enterovirga sp. TaxID=2026352 RepID=UPI0035C94C9A
MAGVAASALGRPVQAASPSGSLVDGSSGAGRTAAVGEVLVAKSSDGLRLSVRAYGDAGKREILLVHGLGQSRLSWARQIDVLAERFRVVAYDLRGHGDSDRPASVEAYTEGPRWADDLHAVGVAAGLRRPVLVGWSLGGLIVGHYLAKYGDGRVAGVNLVDAVTKLSPELLGSVSVGFAGDLASSDLSVRSNAIVMFLSACFARAPPEAELRQMLVYNGMVPRELQEGIGRISSNGVDEAFAIPPRMLVTYGGRDALTRPEMSNRVLALNSRATLSLYPNSGHAPFYEEADRFNAELAAFAAA